MGRQRTREIFGHCALCSKVKLHPGFVKGWHRIEGHTGVSHVCPACSEKLGLPTPVAPEGEGDKHE